jgi:phage I-like protein
VTEGAHRRTESAHGAVLTDEDRLAAKLLGMTEEAFTQAKQLITKE